MSQNNRYVLTEKETQELRMIQTILNTESFKLALAEANTLLIPHYEQWHETQTALVALLQRHINETVIFFARSRGIEGTVRADISRPLAFIEIIDTL